jgi:hypothetical protein
MSKQPGKRMLKLRKKIAGYFISVAEDFEYIARFYGEDGRNGLCYHLSRAVDMDDKYMNGAHSAAIQILHWLYRDGRRDARAKEPYWFDHPTVLGRRIVAAILAAKMVEAGECDFIIRAQCFSR